MKKFDPFSYQEVPVNEEIKAPQGRLRVLCSAPCAIYVTVQGYEVLASVTQETDLRIDETFTVKVDAKKGTRAFMYMPEIIGLDKTGEVMTNPDRGLQESGTMAVIRQEVRKIELAQRAALQKMQRDHKAEMARMKGKVDDKPKQEETRDEKTSQGTSDAETQSEEKTSEKQEE